MAKGKKGDKGKKKDAAKAKKKAAATTSLRLPEYSKAEAKAAKKLAGKDRRRSAANPASAACAAPWCYTSSIARSKTAKSTMPPCCSSPRKPGSGSRSSPPARRQARPMSSGVALCMALVQILLGCLLFRHRLTRVTPSTATTIHGTPARSGSFIPST